MKHENYSVKFFVVYSIPNFFLKIFASTGYFTATIRRSFNWEIINVGDLEISYKLPNDLNGPTLNIQKSKVLYIFMESGEVINYSTRILEVTPERKTLLDKLNNSRNAIKWEVLSFISNDICFGYERYLFKNQSVEFKIAYIGAGNETIEGDAYSKGFFLKLGYKFSDTQKNYTKIFYRHYLKPEIGYSKFKADKINFSSTSLILNYGILTPFTGRAVFEFYGGMGISYNDYLSDQYIDGIHYVGINRRYFYSNYTLGGTKPGFSACVSGGVVLSIFF